MDAESEDEHQQSKSEWSTSQSSSGRALLESLKLQVPEGTDGNTVPPPHGGSVRNIHSILASHPCQEPSISVSFPVDIIQERASILISRYQSVLHRYEQHQQRVRLLRSQQSTIQCHLQEHRLAYQDSLEKLIATAKHRCQLTGEVERAENFLGAVRSKYTEYAAMRDCRLRMLSDSLRLIDYPSPPPVKVPVIEDTVRLREENLQLSSSISIASSPGMVPTDVRSGSLNPPHPLYPLVHRPYTSTQLHFACAVGTEVESVAFILQRHPLLRFAEDEAGNSALHIACMAARPQPEIVELLVKAGVPGGLFNQMGLSPFHIAVLNLNDSSHAVKKALLGCGISVNERTRDGLTPLQLVCSDDTYADVATFLVDQGAALFATTVCRNEDRNIRLSALERSRIHRMNAIPTIMKAAMRVSLEELQ